jgi:hypothetical protein
VVCRRQDTPYDLYSLTRFPHEARSRSTAKKVTLYAIADRPSPRRGPSRRTQRRSRSCIRSRIVRASAESTALWFVTVFGVKIDANTLFCGSAEDQVSRSTKIRPQMADSKDHTDISLDNILRLAFRSLSAHEQHLYVLGAFLF